MAPPGVVSNRSPDDDVGHSITVCIPHGGDVITELAVQDG